MFIIIRLNFNGSDHEFDKLEPMDPKGIHVPIYVRRSLSFSSVISLSLWLLCSYIFPSLQIVSIN